MSNFSRANFLLILVTFLMATGCHHQAPPSSSCIGCEGSTPLQSKQKTTTTQEDKDAGASKEAISPDERKKDVSLEKESTSDAGDSIDSPDEQKDASSQKEATPDAGDSIDSPDEQKDASSQKEATPDVTKTSELCKNSVTVDSDPRTWTFDCAHKGFGNCILECYGNNKKYIVQPDPIDGKLRWKVTGYDSVTKTYSVAQNCNGVLVNTFHRWKGAQSAKNNTLVFKMTPMCKKHPAITFQQASSANSTYNGAAKPTMTYWKEKGHSPKVNSSNRNSIHQIHFGYLNSLSLANGIKFKPSP